MKNLKIMFGVIIFFVIAIIAIYFLSSNKTPQEKIPVGNYAEKTDTIVIDSPLPNASVGTQLTLSGKAKGTWYFEGSFPINVYDSKGNILGLGIGVADQDWMTEDFVTFTSSIKISTSSTEYGTIVFKRDNPSDLPENDDLVILPVKFSNF